MNEIMGSRYDSDLAEKEAMGYKIAEDDVPEARMAEFGDPQYIALEKTDNPKTFTVLTMPAAAPQEMPSNPEFMEPNPDMTTDETNRRIKNILGEDMLAGKPEEANPALPAEPVDTSKITDVREAAEQRRAA